MKHADIIEAIYDEQKRSYGLFAAYVWMGAGLYLFLSVPTLSFLSLKALLYFAVGTLAATLIFGPVTQALLRLFAKTAAGVTQRTTPGTAVVLGLLGLGIMIIEAVVIYSIAAFFLME